VVSLVVAAILAHFLAPSAFGLVALASVMIVALTTLQESGLGLAVIHRRTDLAQAAGTAFAFTSAAAIVLYGVAFAIAPLLADIFSQPHLTSVARVLALTVILRGVGLVPGALIERELSFARRAKGELAATLVQAAVAIPLALTGFGVWSLVAGQLAGQSVQSVIFWIVTPLRPSARLFSFKVLRELGRFGRYVTAANVIQYADQNVDTAMVGRLLGAGDVGFYNMAWRLANLPATGISYIIGRVMFPAYARLQDDRQAFREAFLANVRRVALFSLPVAIGILATAHSIVVGLFGERWEPAVEPLQILGLFGLVRSFAGTTAPVIQAAGKPHLIFRLNVWHLAVLCAGLLTFTPRFGLGGTATAVTVASVASAVPAYWFALRILDLPLRELVGNVKRPAACSIPPALCLLVLERLPTGLGAGAQLVLLVACGASAFAGATYVIARSELHAIGAAFRSS
jgi:O-antigen/teichoic acid export membrane protein